MSTLREYQQKNGTKRAVLGPWAPGSNTTERFWEMRFKSSPPPAFFNICLFQVHNNRALESQEMNLPSPFDISKGPRGEKDKSSRRELCQEVITKLPAAWCAWDRCQLHRSILKGKKGKRGMLLSDEIWFLPLIIPPVSLPNPNFVWGLPSPHFVYLALNWSCSSC